MIEQEYKVMITEQESQLLTNTFTWDKMLTQINFYYDNIPSNLHQRGIVVRIRGIRNKLFLQVKIAQEKDNNIYISNEFEKTIDVIPYCILGNDLTKLCNQNISFSDVYLQGYLQTDRMCKAISTNTVLYLDTNYYLDNTDYELEIEYDTMEDLHQALRIIQDLNINIYNQGISKSKRFFQLIGDQT